MKANFGFRYEATGLGMRFVILSLVVCAVASVSSAVEPVPSDSFDYFYIEANEGDSSGGHTAIRFGGLTYHFQNQAGLVVLRRDFTREFIYTYALLSNRPIHSSRVGVTTQNFEKLSVRFRRRHRIQERQLQVLESIRKDRDLVEAVLRAEKEAKPRSVEVEVMIPGAGYFEARSLGVWTRARSAAQTPSPPVHARQSVSTVALRERLIERYGADFLSTRRAAIERELERAIAQGPTAWKVALPKDAYDVPPHSLHWSGRIQNLASGLEALDILAAGGALSIDALQSPTAEEFALNGSERDALIVYAQSLETRLVVLANSQREDWAPAFLTGLARIETLRRSATTGFLVFLDSYADDAQAIDRRVVARRSAVMTSIRDEARQHFDSARRRFMQTNSPGERDWMKLEERANRLFELQRGLSEQREVRIHHGHLVPRRAASVRVRIPEGRSDREWRESLARILARERAYRRQLENLYAYQLVTRNCVTEIFATINRGFLGSPMRSQRAIGGYIDGYSGLAFVPFVSAHAVNTKYRVIERETIDSYRQARLREMREVENRRWVDLRESNTLTATSYDRSEYDSFFIFFTDGSPVLRPLLGAVNVVAGLGETVWGGLRVPFDRGQTLLRGLKGMIVSLPELAFINIRKGSNDWVAPEYRRITPRD